MWVDKEKLSLLGGCGKGAHIGDCAEGTHIGDCAEGTHIGDFFVLFA
jgi:hypothetical protein